MGKEKIGPAKNFESKKEDNWEFKIEQEVHLKNFYRAFYQFLEDKDYFDIWGGERYETFYDEKFHPNGSREYRIRWRAYNKTSNSNVMQKFVINWLVLGCNDKQKVIDGKKIKIQKAEVEIKCDSYMLVNKDMLKKSRLINQFSNLFFNRWFHYLYEGYKDEMKKRSKDMEEFLKSQMNMNTYTNQSSEFHRVQGFKDPHST
ncbi:hypothetical protein C0585_02350 [Candidatus Woesearchaeota archaeon]|nr:MAG: hypothetical protein C0585_02350 [Candidatus Woesearchaeota archaeon]